MKSWGSFALALMACAVFGGGPSLAGSCRAKTHDNCFNVPNAIDFSAVPDISQQIVREEPVAEKPRVLEAPPITTYTGPTVGVSSMAHTPTIGYYWSLEPDSKNQ